LFKKKHAWVAPIPASGARRRKHRKIPKIEQEKALDDKWRPHLQMQVAMHTQDDAEEFPGLSKALAKSTNLIPVLEDEMTNWWTPTQAMLSTSPTATTPSPSYTGTRAGV
jgi:hypothetical protein